MWGPAPEGFEHENKREVPKRKTDDDDDDDGTASYKRCHAEGRTRNEIEGKKL